jgi:hypothetical protein
MVPTRAKFHHTSLGKKSQNLFGLGTEYMSPQAAKKML